MRERERERERERSCADGPNHKALKYVSSAQVSYGSGRFLLDFQYQGSSCFILDASKTNTGTRQTALESHKPKLKRLILYASKINEVEPEYHNLRSAAFKKLCTLSLRS